MLALPPPAPSPSPSPLGTDQDGSGGEMDGFSIGANEFPEYFSGGNLLDSIDFDDDDDLFIGIEVDGDLLPDLEMDFAEFSSSGGEESVSEMNMSSSVWADHQKLLHIHIHEGDSRKEEKEEEEEKASGSGSGPSLNIHGATASKKEESVGLNPSHKRRKSSVKSKNHQVLKRKVKVDWTPELHRRFVQAVEQLGVDKAVPSRILEIMGIDCLTRHNIASHLQKYRSHRKHLQAREAEAASWSQRRQMYGAAGGRSKSMSPWIAPATIGFPPTTPVLQHFRPLHVWGHPSMDQSLKHIWPKHLVPSPSPSPPPPPWAPNQRVGNSVTSGTPCFLPPLATMRFPAPPLVPGIPPPPPPLPHAMYRVEPGIGIVPTRQTGPHPPADFHPSKESIDAAIGDVVSKPWLPLPLGLKPPSLDSVLVELQRHGIPKIPPPN